ncbi:hypothetical protein LTR36_004035 [Oleoguttula mirabilis]|uniref:2EXR domain-containing protein n=1 Tax=Oleoguttula mirabilis TaxID=1507867 RepID=A0AAV9JIQ2_9PEZI|nr:hypothetical protein LTR36_004035 [Oleoguttula mirabilis]
MADPAPPPQPTQCALLELPAELRNRVWSLALSRYDSAHDRERPNYVTEWDSGEELRVPGILQVCSQIRQEALPMYYATATFYLEVGESLHTSKAWVDSLGGNACYIRRLLVGGPIEKGFGGCFTLDVEISDFGVVTADFQQPARLGGYESSMLVADKVLEAVEKFFAERSRLVRRPLKSKEWTELLDLIDQQADGDEDDEEDIEEEDEEEDEQDDGEDDEEDDEED